MGGFYGSIHVRTEDREAVRAAVEGLRCEGVRKFFIAPAIDGWVTVYPEQNGQDSAVSEALSLKLPGMVVVHCMVHDDDVFAYWVFENGRGLDAYNSCPTYFGEEDPAERGGDAQRLKHLLVDPQKVNELQRLLDAERFTFELERQDRFADFLALPNTAYAYEYLKEGETDGVRQWKKFIHIPDLALEKERRKAAVAQERARLKQLKADRILLFYEQGPKNLLAFPLWTIRPRNSELLLSWRNYAYANPHKQSWVQLRGPDWREDKVELPTAEPPLEIAYSQSGRFVALLLGEGNEISIADEGEGRIICRTKLTGNLQAMAFSVDESCLFVIVSKPGRNELQRLPFRSTLGEVVLSHPFASIQKVIPHPGGKLLAAVDNNGILLVIDVEGFSILNEVWIKETTSTLPENVTEEMMMDALAEMSEKMRQMMSPDEFRQYRKESERNFLFKANILSAVFSPDGQGLFCGTSDGLRVLEWADILQCPAMEPVPVRLSVCPEAAHEDDNGESITDRYVQGVAYDAVRERVLFTAGDKVFFLELKDQHTGEVLKGPADVSLFNAGLTPDRTALVVSGRCISTGSKREKPPSVQVWSYPALCRAAELVH